MSVKGKRQKAEENRARGAAGRRRRSMANCRANQKASKRGTREQMRRDAERAATKRAMAAAQSQRLPNGMQGPKDDSLPVRAETIGLTESTESMETMDWTQPGGGRQSGGGGGGNGLAENGEPVGFWAGLSPVHRFLFLAAGGYGIWHFARKRK